MTDAEELRRLLGEGTKGPWLANKLAYVIGANSETVAVTHDEAHANAALIVAMHAALPGLLDRVEELETAMRRIAEATPNSTNSATAAQMASWTRAVALTAIERALSPSMKVERKQ